MILTLNMIIIVWFCSDITSTEALHRLYASNWSKPSNFLDIYTFAMSADKKNSSTENLKVIELAFQIGKRTKSKSIVWHMKAEVWNFSQFNTSKLFFFSIIHLFEVSSCNFHLMHFLRIGTQGAFEAEVFVRSSSYPSKDLFLNRSWVEGKACCALQGSDSQAQILKQQTPPRSRLWGGFI